NNSGAVTVLQGTLSFQAGGTMDGTFSASAGATHNTTAARDSIADVTPGVRGAGGFQFSGGNTYFTVPITNFTLSGGTLSGTNTEIGRASCRERAVSSALTVVSNGKLNINGSVTFSGSLTNRGSVNGLSAGLI